MEDFHSNWLTKSNAHPKPSLKPPGHFYNSQLSDKDKWLGSSENVPSFSPELSHRPSLNFYEPDGFLISNKEEDNFGLNAHNSGFRLDYHHQYPANADRLHHLDGMLSGNFTRRIEDHRHDYYHIRRSRGVSFFSEQEGIENEHARNQDFDFIRYFSNHGNQDIGSPKEKPKIEPDAINLMEEDDHAFNMCRFPPNNINMLRDLTQCFQPKDLHQILHKNIESTENTSPSRQNPDSVDQKLTRKLDESPRPRKKRKYNNSNTVVNSKKNEGSNALKLKKSKSLAAKNSALKDTQDTYPSEVTPFGQEAIEEHSQTNLQQNKIDSDANPSTDSTQNISISDVPQEVKLENTLPLLKSQSFDVPLGDPQNRRPEGLGRLFQGFQLPAEVEEFIGKSKIFTSLQQLVTKKIGTLTKEERQAKVERYLEKRKGRTWSKKINYDCRKKVAETRLRLKGRFVTKAQAFSMLQEEGIKYNPNEITDSEIKGHLERILETRKLKEGKKSKESKSKKGNKSIVKMEPIDQGMTQTPGSDRYDDYTQSVTDEGQEEF